MRQSFNILYVFLLFLSLNLKAQTSEAIQIAFLADVHLQDLYGNLEDNNYKGIVNPKNGKPTILRTMESQLHSTRIFNENYFAFLAALEDIAKRGIHYVALPGDYSDDGQPIHIRGLQKILDDYSKKYTIQFFITTGNHDPVGPFAQESGKDDFLGSNGKRQPIYSKEGIYASDEKELPPIITKDIAKMGYLGITSYLKDYGFFPKENYTFWATPFSTYTSENYDFAKAQKEAFLENRTYEIQKGFTIPDVSYVVEPVDGIWLLAIDGNVYIPKSNSNSVDPENYSGADLGYNNVLSHKKHLINWVHKITEEAKKKGKTVIAFSHYPMVEFNDDASAEIESLMGKGKWQLNRIPKEEVAQTFADAGLKIHFGGHMHINDTGIRISEKGNTLVNIQTPSLAAYIPAYKLLTIKPNAVAEVETIIIGEVPRFDELFDLYKMEHDYLKSQNEPTLWNDQILKTKTYHEFTDFHLKELVRLRFLPEDWPEDFSNFLSNISGENLLILSNLNTDISFDELLKNKEIFKQDWKKATTETKKQLKLRNLKLSSFQEWKGINMIIDFYRIRSADKLAIVDIGEEKISQYKLISECFFKNYSETQNAKTQKQLSLFLTILNKFLSGAPADHFSVDLKSGKVLEIKQ